MKKTVLVALLSSIALFGCDNKSSVKPAESQPSSLDSEHSARNALDYQGIYQGVTLSKDGKRVILNLTIKKDNYIKQLLSETDKKLLSKQTGSYFWNSLGNTIFLDKADNVDESYFIGENRIFKLNSQGERVKGEQAELYSFTKTAD